MLNKKKFFFFSFVYTLEFLNTKFKFLLLNKVILPKWLLNVDIIATILYMIHNRE